MQSQIQCSIYFTSSWYSETKRIHNSQQPDVMLNDPSLNLRQKYHSKCCTAPSSKGGKTVIKTKLSRNWTQVKNIETKLTLVKTFETVWVWGGFQANLQQATMPLTWGQWINVWGRDLQLSDTAHVANNSFSSWSRTDLSLCVTVVPWTVWTSKMLWQIVLLLALAMVLKHHCNLSW